jgi:hypothetical protein
MEHLWSLAGATGGNRSQKGEPRKRLKYADSQPVATPGNGSGAHGKEHVCHRLPTIPFLLERGSTSLLRKRNLLLQTERPQNLGKNIAWVTSIVTSLAQRRE